MASRRQGTPGSSPHCDSNSLSAHCVANAVGSGYVGRRQVRAAFQTGNRSDIEDSFHFRSAHIVTEAGGIPRQLQTIGREGGRDKIKTFLSEEALVAAYWRKLARRHCFYLVGGRFDQRYAIPCHRREEIQSWDPKRGVTFGFSSFEMVNAQLDRRNSPNGFLHRPACASPAQLTF